MQGIISCESRFPAYGRIFTIEKDLKELGNKYISGNKLIFGGFMAMETVQILHYPTLKTVLLVEEILKNAKEPLSRYEIMKRSENKIMRQTLNTTISYLEKRGMALDSEKGVIWTYTPPGKMRKWLRDSVEA